MPAMNHTNIIQYPVFNFIPAAHFLASLSGLVLFLMQVETHVLQPLVEWGSGLDGLGFHEAGHVIHVPAFGLRARLLTLQRGQRLWNSHLAMANISNIVWLCLVKPKLSLLNVNP